MNDYTLKRFDNPDDVRTFEKGKYEIVKLGDSTFGRATYQPGWRWSTHVKPLAGTESCEVDHLGLVLSGRVKVRMNDGAEFGLGPGDLFAVAPGHDSWVVGDEPYTALHFTGAGQYAAAKK